VVHFGEGMLARQDSAAVAAVLTARPAAGDAREELDDDA
jgi:hypothetical protein